MLHFLVLAIFQETKSTPVLLSCSCKALEHHETGLKYQIMCKLLLLKVKVAGLLQSILNLAY